MGLFGQTRTTQRKRGPRFSAGFGRCCTGAPGSAGACTGQHEGLVVTPGVDCLPWSALGIGQHGGSVVTLSIVEPNDDAEDRVSNETQHTGVEGQNPA